MSLLNSPPPTGGIDAGTRGGRSRSFAAGGIFSPSLCLRSSFCRPHGRSHVAAAGRAQWEGQPGDSKLCVIGELEPTNYSQAFHSPEPFNFRSNCRGSNMSRDRCNVEEFVIEKAFQQNTVTPSSVDSLIFFLSGVAGPRDARYHHPLCTQG